MTVEIIGAEGEVFARNGGNCRCTVCNGIFNKIVSVPVAAFHCQEEVSAFYSTRIAADAAYRCICPAVQDDRLRAVYNVAKYHLNSMLIIEPFLAVSFALGDCLKTCPWPL
jgi:bacterioferritin-associated ferredoxin